MNVMNNITVMPAKTITGNGTVFELFDTATPFGSKGLVVYAPSFKKNGYLEKLKSKQPKDIEVLYFEYAGKVEPTLALLEELKNFAEDASVDWVAGIGGGSVLDLTKAATGLIGGKKKVSDYHDGVEAYASNIPFIAVSTTAGTGSEATPAAVFINEETMQKKPIVNIDHMASVIIIDSEMLAKCPKSILAASGMDALTQAIEAYTSNVTTPFTDAIALTSIKYISDSLALVYDKYNKDKAEMLLTGSYLSGVALANAKLGVVHGLAHPLGSRTHAPHGLICAVLLPYAIELNKEVIGEKYNTMSEIVGEDIVGYINKLIEKFNLVFEVSKEILEDKDAIVAETQNGATKFNPRPVSTEEIITLINHFVK